ncbi:AbrB/MazE/SpoVT family DNA-binding domain-containing protein [Paenibacillus sp. YYML68]|uniref:AbrB/MazE/SpoVT family DNA-binding domain-containing protein n=1 Tax=Paenibacillus sp. YYML68 TaxID=2909250 RepID=UPI0024906DD4|nr:AbrB/MazE/SpoVT family DNA-binding domain-containing protein [Paenibacillus sp. YYML68]
MDVAKVLIKYQVTLPKEVREKLAITIGERVIFIETEQGIMIKKALRLHQT